MLHMLRFVVPFYLPASPKPEAFSFWQAILSKARIPKQDVQLRAKMDIVRESGEGRNFHPAYL